ncbi:antiviral innate immune response receptor RIG-I-like [Dreissena polymorpha]|uniref:RNA helicase n=1 Tax=Dreissena polymorpha TaxID=45954 RepID=A0A9D4GKC8_DREPO|nr:antiviral innate immune response receptor RIG-I-like [Dreissena polymorpha]KAH3816690.1 hypothetical protein DPMN_118211 [Dreissena polymorpha]
MIDLLLENRPAGRDTQAYNNWTADLEKRAQLSSVHDPQMSRDISACAVYLNVYNSAIEVSNLLQITDVARYLAERHSRGAEGHNKHSKMEKKLFDKLKDVQKNLIKLRNDKDAANPNVQTVSERLQTMILEKGDASRAIVFVKARASCHALAQFLETDLRRIGARVSPFYGQQTKLADEGMTESAQNEILQTFRDGYFKVMVSTSVGTEGIDVPDCNIVINYNYSGNEITMIQMKGRSRKKGATITVMGDDKLLEQEEINAYKANMMYKAIEELNKSDLRIGQKVKNFQADEMQKHRTKIEYEKAKTSRRSLVDLEIMCRHCSAFACLVSNVRKIGKHHFVVDKDFPSKVTTMPHKNPKKYDQFDKKLKMNCKKCPWEWGVVSDRDGFYYYTLKLTSFKMKNTLTGVISQYKQWLDVPYEVPEIGLDDIPKLYQNETEASVSGQ